MNRAKTFIHHDGALGDVLLSVPCIRAIHDVSSGVHFAGREDIGRLLCDAGIVREVSSAGGSFYSSLYTDSTDDALRVFLRGFGQAFVFTARGESLPALNIRDLVPDVKIIRTIPDAGERTHVSMYRFRQLKAHGGLRADLSVSDHAREKALHLLQDRGCGLGRKTVTIHPGSGGKKKCWPLMNYLELIATLQEHYDAFVVLITGPAEDGRMKDEIRAYSAGQGGIMHMDSGDLTTVAALLGMSGLYIGNDSGISHLAAAVKAPSLVLFGPTDPVLWQPVGAGVLVVTAGAFPSSLEDIRVADVYERAAGLLGTAL